MIKSLETRQQRYNSLVLATGPAVADAGKLRRLSCSEDDFIYFLPVAATSLRAGFQVYLSKLWVVDVTKEVRYDLSIYCLLSDIILFFYLLLQPLLELGSKSTSLSSGFSDVIKAAIRFGFTRRTVFRAPAFQQKGINRLMDIYQIWKPKL